jgi:hypothetical protein
VYLCRVRNQFQGLKKRWRLGLPPTPLPSPVEGKEIRAREEEKGGKREDEKG